MWYQNAGKTSRQEYNCSKAHALLAIIEMEGMEIWQEREMKRFYWSLFNYCLERVVLNMKLIILCNLYAKKPVMCEFTTTSLRDATWTSIEIKYSASLFCKKKYQSLISWTISGHNLKIRLNLGGFWQVKTAEMFVKCRFLEGLCD